MHPIATGDSQRLGAPRRQQHCVGWCVSRSNNVVVFVTALTAGAVTNVIIVCFFNSHRHVDHHQRVPTMIIHRVRSHAPSPALRAYTSPQCCQDGCTSERIHLTHSQYRRLRLKIGGELCYVHLSSTVVPHGTTTKGRASSDTLIRAAPPGQCRTHTFLPPTLTANVRHTEDRRQSRHQWVASGEETPADDVKSFDGGVGDC